VHYGISISSLPLVWRPLGPPVSGPLDVLEQSSLGHPSPSLQPGQSTCNLWLHLLCEKPQLCWPFNNHWSNQHVTYKLVLPSIYRISLLVSQIHSLPDSRWRGWNMFYLVDWIGYGPEEWLWVAADGILGFSHLIYLWISQCCLCVYSSCLRIWIWLPGPGISLWFCTPKPCFQFVPANKFCT